MPAEYLIFTPVVLVDSSEQLPYSLEGIEPDDIDPALLDPPAPYTFAGIRGDARQKNLSLIIGTRVANLIWGDYSLDGYETKVAVERKSLADLFATIGWRRESFEAEIAALNEYDVATVIIEANWPDILTNPPKHSKLCPKSVTRTILAWSQRYPHVHWLPAGDRRMAEVTTFRILERFYRDRTEAK